MNMQALMQQAQKMQKEMQKKQAELEDKLRVLKLIKTLLIQKKKKC